MNYQGPQRGFELLKHVGKGTNAFFPSQTVKNSFYKLFTPSDSELTINHLYDILYLGHGYIRGS